MIIRSSVAHNVSFFVFCKHWLKRVYNSLPSVFIKPLESETLFVFVVGCGHSGTTLMAAKLSNHPAVMGIGRETGVLAPGNHSLFGVRAIMNEWSYFSEFHQRTCVLEKTPKHIHSYERAQKITRNNKFVIMIRNPLDTIASLYKRFGDLEFCIERWVIDNQEALKHKHKENVIIVKYEDFTEEPEKIAVEITSFLGIGYDPLIIEDNSSIYEKVKQKDNMSLRKEQVSKPINPNTGGWKKVFDNEQASKIVNRTAKLAEDLGYDPDTLKV